MAAVLIVVLFLWVRWQRERGALNLLKKRMWYRVQQFVNDNTRVREADLRNKLGRHYASEYTEAQFEKAWYQMVGERGPLVCCRLAHGSPLVVATRPRSTCATRM